MEDNATFQVAIRYATGIFYPRIADASTSAFVTARKIPTLSFFEEQLSPAQLRQSEPQKPYKQKPLLTRQRTRLIRLKTHILRKTPLFFFEQYQQKIIENPEYYGVCIIDKLFNINPGQRLGWTAQEQAIVRENELRAKGY